MSTVRVESLWTQVRFMSLAGAVLAAGAIAWFVFSYGYLEDDAFIHLEFARSIAEGQGFAFNGHVLYGDTAPLWALILAGVHSLGLSWILSAKLACIAGFLLAVSGAWRLGRALANDDPALQLLPPFAVVVTVVNPYFAHWVFSGMESVTALGLSFWAVAIGLTGTASLRRYVGAALLLGVGPLLRPELILLTAIAGVALMLRYWQASSQAAISQRLAMIAVLGLMMALPVAIWSAYAWHTFGGLLPTTNRAKQGGPLSQIGPRLLSVYATGFPVTLALLPLVTLSRLVPWRVPIAVAVLLGWPLACIAFYLFDHTALQTRYALLSVPSLGIAVLWFLAAAHRPRLLLATTAVTVLIAALTISWIVVPHLENKQKYIETLSAASAFVRSQIPPNAPVAIFAIGQIAFETRHPLVDIGGINDPSVIPHMASATETLEWAKAHGARYYVSAAPPEPGAVRVFSGPAPFLGWTFHRSLYESQQPLAIYLLP